MKFLSSLFGNKNRHDESTSSGSTTPSRAPPASTSERAMRLRQLVSVRATPGTHFAMIDEENTMRVLFELKTEDIPREDSTSEPTRTPIDLCLVLDCSGSMSGDKLARSQDAMCQVIDNLTRDDRLTIVRYSSGAEVSLAPVVVGADQKERLKKLVRRISATGSTNLHAGLKCALKAVGKKAPSDGVARLRRMFVFSDGQINCGDVTNTSGLCQFVEKEIVRHGISLCAFGVGKSFNEELMEAIAESGNGQFFYIESADRIEEYVGAALNGLLGLVALQAELRVTALSSGKITHVYGHEDNKTLGHAWIGDVRQSNTKNILVEFTYTPPADASTEGAFADALHWELHASDIAETPFSLEGDVALTSTSDRVKTTDIDPDVEVSYAVQEAARIDAQVLEAIERDAYDEAAVLKTREIETLERCATKDKTGRIGYMISKGKQFRTEMQQPRRSKAALSKKAKYHSKMKRHDSCDYFEAGLM